MSKELAQEPAQEAGGCDPVQQEGGGQEPAPPKKPTPLPEPRVIVLFREDVPDPAPVAPMARLLAPERLTRQDFSRDEIALLAPLPAHRLHQAVPLERLRRLDELTRRSRFRRGASAFPLGGHRILVPPQEFGAEKLVDALRRLPEVGFAYVERAVGLPCDTSACVDLTDLSASQSWLVPAPQGISARFCWTLGGGRGEGIPFVVVDAGFHVESSRVCHCDLNPGITMAWGGTDDAGLKQHGMSSIGLAVARHDRGGIQGIAPSAGPVQACSYLSAPAAMSYVPALAGQGLSTAFVNPWNALAKAIDLLELSAGSTRPVPGVLLVELQIESPNPGLDAWGPAEGDPALRALLGVAAALGITVIEPAGNGGSPVADTFAQGDPARGAASSSAGAFLVGASEADRSLRSGSNTGAMLDCFALGADVASLGFSDANPRTSLTHSFSGTSSAGAIVAGAALAVQGLYRSIRGVTLRPDRLRSYLRELGTPAIDPLSGDRSDLIGLQPNLARLAERFGHAPVYFQDYPGHVGASHTQTNMSSPDLFIGALEGQALLDFQVNGGFGSSTAVPLERLTPGSTVELWLRLCSRGGEALPAVTIDLFAVPEPPTSDADWLPLGTVTLPSLAELSWTVAGPVSLTLPATLPATTLVVAIARSPCFPKLLFEADGRNGAAFFPFVQRNPRVTFRRFTVG